MYTGKNFKKKEDLEKAVKKGEKVTLYLPRWVRRITHQKVPTSGIVPVMGPHIHLRDLRNEEDKTPEVKQHEWFADVKLVDGVVKEVF
jgi:hypothetical protein